MDELSELLRPVRIDAALFLHGEFRQPWSVAVPRSIEAAPLLRPDARELAILHCVLEGRCWVRLEGEPPLELLAGDVGVFTRGAPHLLGSGVRHAPVELKHVVSPKFPCLDRLSYGGDGEACLIACGWLAYEPDLPNPLISSLPAFFRAELGRRPGTDWLRPSLLYALQEGARAGAGAAAMTERVAETLFLEAVRCHLESQPQAKTGWLAGLRDPQVRRCLSLLHERPHEAWSVESLARAVHVSRSVLAERFTQSVGCPPMHYLKKLRLVLASRMLAQERGHLLRVANAVGYRSEAAFIRAFKAEYGVTPGEWRQQRPVAGTPAPG